MPRSPIIWTKSRALSLKLRYQRTHSTITSRSNWRPLNRSTSDLAAVIPAIIAAQGLRFAPEPDRRHSSERDLLLDDSSSPPTNRSPDQSHRNQHHETRLRSSDHGGLWQISTSGGSKPVWSRDGRE